MSGVDGLHGRTLGDFVLRDKLGEGQFGSVYRAEQPMLEREAVVKILRDNHRSSTATIQRFMREARLAARLEHPYAAHIYAFGAEPDGLLWIAMELVRGTPLEQLLTLQGPLPLTRLVPLLEKLSEVIQAAHEQGIVHRDIKPANVMAVSRGGRLWPKLLDFGVAKLVADSVAEPPLAEADPVAALDARLTDGRTRMGSPAYMAAELWRDSTAADARSDQYALGVLAFQSLTGRLPFVASSLAMLARAHAERPLPSLGGGLPDAVHAVLARAMAKQPAERYANVTELAAALRSAAGLDESRAHLPALDEPVRLAWLHGAPQPLAEAVAALDAAAAVPHACEAVVRLLRVVAHWLGIVALACRPRIAAGGGDAAIGPMLQAMRRRLLGDEEWLELARELCRPFAAQPDAFPVPELVALLCTGDGAPAFSDELLALRAATLQAAAAPPNAARGELQACMARLGACLLRLGFVADYDLVVLRPDRPRGEAERWMGVRRTPRPTLTVAGVGDAVGGEPLLVGRDGCVVAPLSPLVQVAPPAPGSVDELFLLEGSGRHGAKLVAVPFGFERYDERPWQWLQNTFSGTDPGDDLGGNGRAPYRGLDPFTPADADVFFGREREAVAFGNRLRTQPLVAVVGASGAGKSSFVQAGVIPTLPESFRAVTVRPGARPTAVLLSRLRGEGWLGSDDPADVAAELRARAAERKATLLVVVDQFEELFTLGSDADERQRYATLLAALARAADDPVRVVLTVRDDFLMRAQTLPPLRAHLASGLELLATPSPADLLRIIVEPARRAGYSFDPAELPLEIVEAVAHQPGALALVSFTAAKMWELRDIDQQLLPRRAYDALGGVGGALAQHAEETLARMPSEQVGRVRGAFRHLVTADGTRAVVSRRDLVALVGSGAEAEAAIEQLVSTRLLVSSEGVDGVEQIEVVHEALLSAWPRLVEWRREDVEGARLRDQLRAAARPWHERGRSRGLLWRDDALVELKLWRARHALQLTETEEAFVAASVGEAARGRRLRAAALAATFVALVGGLAVVRGQRARAEAQAAVARHRLGEQYEEQARQSFLAGSAQRALVYLQEAAQLGVDDRARRFLFAAAAHATAAERGVLVGHTGGVRVAIFSPDGTRLATASEDKTARLWDARSRRLLATLSGHDATIVDLAFSPDGTRLATASHDGSARLWDGVSGAPLYTLRHGGAVLSAQFRADGARLVTASKDGLARIFDVASGRLERTLVGHRDRVRWAAFSPDGTRVITAADDNSSRLWDGESGRSLYTFPCRRVMAHAAFSPDGSRVALASDDDVVFVYRVADGKLLHELDGHTDFVRWVAFSRDGQRLATGSWDDTARVWDVDSGRQLLVLAHGGGVGSAVFSPDGTRLVTAGTDGTAKLWDASGGGLVAVLEAHQGPVPFAAFSPDGALVITASADRTARLWDAHAGAPLLEVRGDEPNGARLSPDGRLLVVANGDGRALLFDAHTGAPLGTFGVRGDKALTVATFTPDGRSLLTAGYDGAARLFDVASGARLVELLGHSKPVTYATVSADGRRVATASEDNSARVWSAVTGALELVLSGHTDNVSGVAFSPDGARLATSSWDRSVRLWDAHTGRLLRATGGHASSLQNVTFSPDGRRLLVGQDNGTGNLYDVDTGAAAGTLVGHVGMLEQTAFSADGTLIATGGNDRTVRLWDAATLRLLAVNASARLFVDDVSFDRDGTRLVTASGDGVIRLFPLPHFAGDAAAAATLVRCRAPFRLEGGKLVPQPAPSLGICGQVVVP